MGMPRTSLLSTEWPWWLCLCDLCLLSIDLCFLPQCQQLLLVAVSSPTSSGLLSYLATFNVVGFKHQRLKVLELLDNYTRSDAK